MRFDDHPVGSNDYERAGELRKQASPHEQKLWFALRQAGKENGIKFRRQQPIHPYIVDFVCMKAKLVIELDGMSHDTRQVYDQKRTAYLNQQGYTVVRFSNDEVVQNVTGVAETIALHAKSLLQELEVGSQLRAPSP